MVALMLDMVPPLVLPSLLRETVQDLVTVAAQHIPELQVLLLGRIPGIDPHQSWILDLVKNDTTGLVVKFLLRQGVNNPEIDEHGWSLIDFAYVTDKILWANKTDEEISRVSRQDYRYPDSWVSVATDEQRAKEATRRRARNGDGDESELPVKFRSRMPKMAYAPFRADHPVPPNRAFYFEVKIIKEGDDGRFTAVGLCTKDTDKTEMDPSDTRIPWKNLGYLYFGSGRVEKSGEMVGQAEPFGKGDVIGCHVDLARGMMYFRKNGERIGLVSLPSEVLSVSGRLFPCFVTGSRSCEILANFKPPSGGFVYEREEDGEFYD
ncbi:hypothetical protein B0T16DRAFT_416851, partial [Cercophora newfieldiana]